MDKGGIPDELQRIDGLAEVGEVFLGDFRRLYLFDNLEIGVGVKIAERPDVGVGGGPGEVVGVGFDAVKESGCQLRGGFDIRGPQVFRHNGGGGAVIRPDILEGDVELGAGGVMVDEDAVIGIAQKIVVVRLGIDQGPFGYFRTVDPGDVGNGDMQAADHRQVVGAVYGIHPADYRLFDFSPEQPSQSQGAGNGVRIGNDGNAKSVAGGNHFQQGFHPVFMAGGLGRFIHRGVVLNLSRNFVILAKNRSILGACFRLESIWCFCFFN